MSEISDIIYLSFIIGGLLIFSFNAISAGICWIGSWTIYFTNSPYWGGISRVLKIQDKQGVENDKK